MCHIFLYSGLLSQPKWGHLKDLHHAIKLCEPALAAVDSPEYMKLGPKQEVSLQPFLIHYRYKGVFEKKCSGTDNLRNYNVKRGHCYFEGHWNFTEYSTFGHFFFIFFFVSTPLLLGNSNNDYNAYFQAHVYSEKSHLEGINLTRSESQTKCAAFLANIDEHKAATVTFRGQAYNLPPWSVSILPDCKNTAYNSAKVWLYLKLFEINVRLQHKSYNGLLLLN